MSFITYENKSSVVLLVHGGSSDGKAVDDKVQRRELIQNTYSTEKGLKVWGEYLQALVEEAGLSDMQIINPLFPHGHNAVYTEWERFFEQILNDLSFEKYQNIVLIGHSLGVMFLQMYFAKNNFQERFSTSHLQVHLVACGKEEGDFKVSDSWINLNKLYDRVHIYHSIDDTVIPFEEVLLYTQNLPKAIFHKFEDRDHFVQEQFPELLQNINDILFLE